MIWAMALNAVACAVLLAALIALGRWFRRRFDGDDYYRWNEL